VVLGGKRRLGSPAAVDTADCDERWWQCTYSTEWRRRRRRRPEEPRWTQRRHGDDVGGVACTD